VLTRVAGDALQLYYQLWLARDGLLGPTPLFRDPYQFGVTGPRWNLPQSFPPLALPFLLLSPLGLHRAYDLLVFLSFPLSGLAAYLLVRHLTGHPLGAAAAGVAFALAPSRLGPLFAGQPAGFAAALVPVVLWGLDVALTRGQCRGGILGGAALFALATLEPHYAYLVGGLVPVYVAVRAGGGAGPRPLLGRSVLVFAALGALGAAWLWALRQAFILGSVAEGGRSLAEIRLYSLGPAALRLPETYGGPVLALLALGGLVGSGSRQDRRPRLFYAGVLGAGLLLSLGPVVPGFPLYETLHRWAPQFGLIRNVERFRLLTTLGGTVLAGFAVRTLTARLPARVARYAGLGILAATAAGTAPWHAIAVTRFPDSPIYETLRREARRVLYVPIGPGDGVASSAYLYHVTRTRVPMLNGYSPLVPRGYEAEVVVPLQGLNVGALGPREHALLRRLGVSHLVLDRAMPQASPFPVAFLRERLGASTALALAQAADPLWLFRVTDRPPVAPAAVTSPVGVFVEAEASRREVGAVAGEPTASGGRILRVRVGTDRPGLLTAASALLPPGAYRATWRARGAGLAVEVTAGDGRRRLAYRALEPTLSWADHALSFVLDEAELIELGVRWNGQGDAAVDWISVIFADRPEPEWAFEIEALSHRLSERPDPAASGGAAGYADPATGAGADVVSGPMRRYPAGRYRLVLRARADRVAAGSLLALMVTEPAGRVLATRTVAGNQLPPDTYREVSLPFSLARPTVVEFPIRYLGGAGVLLDRLVLVPEP
jgi:hypothetical protein